MNSAGPMKKYDIAVIREPKLMKPLGPCEKQVSQQERDG